MSQHVSKCRSFRFILDISGCWFVVSGCTAHPNAIGTYRDSYGETHDDAANSEIKCFQRAVPQWKYCGSHNNEQVAAIYGPTGID